MNDDNGDDNDDDNGDDNDDDNDDCGKVYDYLMGKIVSY